MTSNKSIASSKWALPKDAKIAAKVLFNIKESNRLEKLLNERGAHINRISPRINNNLEGREL